MNYSENKKILKVFYEPDEILKPKSVPRKDWEKAFKEMHTNGDDKLFIDDVFNDETFEE